MEKVELKFFAAVVLLLYLVVLLAFLLKCGAQAQAEWDKAIAAVVVWVFRAVLALILLLLFLQYREVRTSFVLAAAETWAAEHVHQLAREVRHMQLGLIYPQCVQAVAVVHVIHVMKALRSVVDLTGVTILVSRQ